MTSAAPAQAATFTVTTIGDSGGGSLRRAIIDAETTAGLDNIDFMIPGAGPNPHVITLVTDLPTITEKVRIRGYTQPGSAKATALAPARLKIVVDASQVNAGLVLRANDSAIRGLVIRRASGAPPDGVGIRVQGDRNHITGNYVGLDGTNNDNFLFGNAGDGVEITGNDNIIGGTAPEDRNVITANGKLPNTDADGVSILGDRNIVHGNTIGTDPAVSTDQIGNTDAGVRIIGDDNLIGGSATGAGNFISGNNSAVQIDSGTGNLILGNLIGTTANGTAALGNSNGVVIDSDGNRVGGTAAGAGNVISGTLTGSGVEVSGDNNIIEGNKVGTDSAGTTALRNNSGGIRVTGDNNTIGGHTAAEANLVSGNGFYGIWISSSAASGNRVQSNLIGTDATGTAPLPNEGEGIRISESDDNKIGGATSGNVIAFNGGAGVSVESGIENKIVRNAIFENVGLGIDLGPAGVTANDAGDADFGANDLLNFPEIDSATTVGGMTTVNWRLSAGLPGTRFQVDFYANDACDNNSGNGEGQTFLGSKFVTTSAAGNVVRSTLMPTAAAVGQSVTATATLAPGGPLPNDPEATSEFSPCETVI